MKVRAILAGTFLLNVFLGSVCMMPMAQARDALLTHEEHMEMAMTPMIPMSPANCEHCLEISQRNHDPMAGGCTGHCLMQATNAAAAASASSGQEICSPPPVASFFAWIADALPGGRPVAAAPPQALSTDTIVLRL